MEDDCAGSCPRRRKVMGISAPENPAAIMDNTMAIAMTKAKPVERLHIKTPIEVVIAMATPLKNVCQLMLFLLIRLILIVFTLLHLRDDIGLIYI